MAGKKKNKGKVRPSGELLAAVNQVARSSRTLLSRNLLDIGLYAGQDGLMLVLDRQDGLTPGAIATELGVKAPTITRSISRLAAQGLVHRQNSSDDRRQSLVYLTDLGRDKIKAISKAQKATEKQALAGFKNKEIKQLMALLEAVETNFAAPGTKQKAEAEPAADDAVDAGE
ncbi:MarR family transcriptional regulator [Pseudohoeflea suaedae]|uniref:MarR family transcriptional regulator n=1 Tax=Pseudohoeflea suaedae TaxID=877384 RepID=A0A4R5PIN8_9HYPH|nr:MarR family transcriptional regulator [Pseudohoeflea suaedae]TDH35021.1 MarR family transcriptional regulator [Pseudohoeflea suaedae]